ncbi:uncharacterized protein A4U43_C02F3570 [Asparagus officinalis]|uniref:Uncharacterized protein n=1 Tax=Asparagus officinalis TaxID=4686 RepID=A0A5P1FFJ7_ASPOF|nr:uncharacterized protein A4U43_C02F3570 [Asparagus officinalis]
MELCHTFLKHVTLSLEFFTKINRINKYNSLQYHVFVRRTKKKKTVFLNHREKILEKTKGNNHREGKGNGNKWSFFGWSCVNWDGANWKVSGSKRGEKSLIVTFFLDYHCLLLNRCTP